MRLGDFFYIIYQGFQTRRSRLTFTILSVAIAIAAVLILVSFGYGLQSTLLSKITTSESLLTLDVSPTTTNAVVLNDAAVATMKKIAGVEKVGTQASYSGQTKYQNLTSEIQLYFGSNDIFPLQGISTQSGRFFNNNTAGEIVVNKVFLMLLGIPENDALNKQVSIVFNDAVTTPGQTEERTLPGNFTIVGLIDGGASAGEVYLAPVNVPSGFTISSYQLVKVKVTNQSLLTNVRAQVVAMGFAVSSISDVVDQANKIFTAVQVTLAIFGIVALVVAAIGLVNTMTISLLERTSEIGIMRAIGAAPKDIKRIFLGESVLIGFLGGVSGILVGIVFGVIVNWLFNILAHSLGGDSVQLFVYPVWFLCFILALSTIVGYIGGMWPARRAAIMNPLEALRYK